MRNEQRGKHQALNTEASCLAMKKGSTKGLLTSSERVEALSLKPLKKPSIDTRPLKDNTKRSGCRNLTII